MRWSGKIGYADYEETAPGIWEFKGIIEKPYRGDMYKDTRRLNSGGEILDSIQLSNEISIIGDQYANKNYGYMQYITIDGSKWKISSVNSTSKPRLVINVGGLYADS